MMNKLLLLGLVLLSGLVNAAERPNILFCMADDWGWPHAGALGDKTVKTPVFDRLAKEGVLFTQAAVNVPSCTPCRNSILTGQAFYRLEQGANLWSTLDVKFPTFVRELADAGYQTGHSQKAWGPGDYEAGGYKSNPCGPNFENFSEFMAGRSKDKPFCFWLGTDDPHRPYENGIGKKNGIDLDSIKVPDFWPDDKKIRSDMADYYYEVERWDSDVGKAIEALKKAGELESTIVVMTGDHGMPFPRCKGNLYDWGSRVPLAIRWGKGIPNPGRRISDFVSLTDLAPTFLEAAGLPVPEVMTANSILPLLKSSKEGFVDTSRDHHIMGRERHCPGQGPPLMTGYPSRGIRTEKWLYILNVEPDRWPAGAPHDPKEFWNYWDCDPSPTKEVVLKTSGRGENIDYFQLCFSKRPQEELYDVQADPYQLTNLAAVEKHAKIKADLKKRLVECLEETEDPRFSDHKKVAFDEYPWRHRSARHEKFRQK